MSTAAACTDRAAAPAAGGALRPARPAGVAQVAPRLGPPGRLGKVRSVGSITGGSGLLPGGLRRFDAYALMYLHAGSGRYRDAERDVALSPGSLVQVFPGRAHWYGVVRPGPWSEVYVVFDGPVFDQAARSGVLDRQAPVRQLTPVAYWRDRLDDLRTRRPPLTRAGADREACELLGLLVELASASAAEEGTPRGPGGWLARSQALLAEDLDRQLDLRAVAASVGMRYETWRKRFAAETGRSPARWRRLRRVETAAELLRRTSLTNREIAASLGFVDESHLARQFRQVTGRSTGGYRRSLG